MIRVLLSPSAVFPARDDGGVRWRGPGLPAALQERFRGVDPGAPDSAEAWAGALAEAAPPFGAIAARDDSVLAAVDRARSFPLFWAVTGRDVLLSDDARRLRDHVGGGARDPAAEAEARLTGFVTGADTLDRRVKQIRPGEVLQATGAGGRPVVRTAAAALPPWNAAGLRGASLRAALDDMLRQLAARVFRPLARRQVVIPLTGGYDSRLVALLARRAGHERVLCIGTHRAGHRETWTSRDVARRLGFAWAHFGGTAETWRSWYASAERRRFYLDADGLCALPPMLEWRACVELRRSGAVDADAVFLSGHLGHFVTGTMTTDRGGRPPDGLAALLRRRRWVLNPWPEIRALADAVRARLETSAADATAGAADLDDAVDRWEWREAQTKREAAAVRAFESAGFEWRLPFADPELAAFWRAAPRSARLDSRLHHEWVRRAGRSFDLPPANPGVDRDRRLRRWLRHGGLDRPARHLRLLARRWDGRGVARDDSLGWAALVDPDEVRRSYTGREGVESYLVRDWLATRGSNDLL